MATASSTIQLALEETPRYEGAVSTTPYRVATDVFYLPIQSGRVVPAPSLINRDDELRGIEASVPSLIETYVPAGEINMRAYMNGLTILLTCAGFKGAVTAGDGTNCIQTFTAGGTITGGTFMITFSGQQTAPLAWNATNAQIQAALEALSNIGVGNVLVGGGPMPVTFTVTFRGALAAAVQALCTVQSSLTGTSPTLTPTITTAGVASTITDPDLGKVTTGAYKWVFTKRGGITAKTMQLLCCYVNEGVFLKGQGFGVSALNLNADGLITSTIAGLVVARVADPNLTPSYDSGSVWPARRGDLTLTWLTGTGTTEDFTLSVNNPLMPRRTLALSPSSFFPDKMEHGDAKANVSGTIPKTVLAPADFDALLSAGTFAAIARWKTAKYVGNSGSPYAAWWSFPNCQIVGGEPDPLSNVRRFGGSFNWDAQYDEVSGADATITLVNSVSSIQAPGVGF